MEQPHEEFQEQSPVVDGGIPAEFAFEQQQNQLAHLRDILQRTQQTLSTTKKEKESYAATLSRIRMQRRGKGTAQRKREEEGECSLETKTENIPLVVESQTTTDNPPRTPDVKHSREKTATPGRVKVNLLQQQVEQTRQIMQQRESLTKEAKQRVEGLAEQLNIQLPELDSSLEHCDPSQSALLSPTTVIDPTSDTSRELYSQVLQKDNKIIELNNRILELERNIMDYQENLREKDELLDAKARSISLITDDMSRRNKTAVDALEETRQEMRTMQNNFVEVESKLKDENQNLKETLSAKEQRLRQLDSLRFDLNTRNAELQQKVVMLQTRSHEVLTQGLPADKERISQLEQQLQELQQRGIPEDKSKIEELEKQLEDNCKQLSKTKSQYGKKIKSLEKQLATVKKSESNEQDLVQLQNRVAELEDEKGNLQLSLVDFDELKVSEGHLVLRVAELEQIVQQQNSDLDSHVQVLGKVETAKLELMQELKQLQASESELQAELDAARGALQEHENAKIEAEMKSVELESRLSDLGASNSELQSQLSSVLKEIESLRVAIQQDEAINKSLSQTQAELELKSNELYNLSTQLDFEKNTKAEIENTLKTTTKNLVIVESALEELKERHENSVSSLGQEISSLQHTLKQTEEETEQLKNQLTALQEELKIKTETYTKNHTAWEEEIANLKCNSKELQEQLQVKEEELTALKVSVEMQGALGEEVERWKSELMQKSQEVQVLTEQLGTSAMEISCLSVKHEKTKELENEIAELARSLKEMEATKSEQDELIHHTQQAVNAKEAEHEAKVESLELEVLKKQQRASDLEEQLSVIVESQQELQHQYNALQNDIAEQKKLKEEAESLVQQFSQRVKQMEDQFKLHISENSNLTEQCQLLQQTLYDRDHSLSVMQNSVRDLQQKLVESNEVVESAGEAEQRVAQLQSEIIQLQRKLQDECTALRQRAEQAEDELSAAFSESERSLKEHQSVQEKWDQERELLQSQILEIQESKDRLEDIVNNLNDNVSSLQVQLNIVIGEKEGVESELGNLKETMQHFHEIKQQHEVYIRQITNLQMELAHEQQLNVTTVQALRDENNNLKSQLQQSNNFISQLEAQLTTEQQNISAQIQSLQNENKLLSSTKEELSGLYADLHKNFFEMQQQKDIEFSNMMRDKQALTDQLSKANTEIDNLRELLHSSENTLDKTKSTVTSQTMEIETLQNRLQQLVNIQEDASVKKSEVINLESKIMDLQKECDQLKTQLQQKENLHFEILSTNTELKAALSEKEKSSKEILNYLNSELESQQNQVKKLECAVVEYTKQIQDYEVGKSKSNEYTQQLTNNLEDSQNYIQLLQNTIADLQSRKQAMERAEMEQAENYMSLTTQMKAMEEANTSLQEEIKGLHRIMEEHPVWQESGDEARELLMELQAMEQERIRLLAEVEMLKVQAGPKLNLPENELQVEMEALQTEVGVLRRELEAAREEVARREHDVVAGWEEPESWGDGSLEEQHLQQQQQQSTSSDQLLVAALQAQLAESEAVQTKLHDELRASQVRCGKLIKQVKILKEQTAKKQSLDLDKVMEEEMQSQLINLQKELVEIRTEKTSLLARADTLIAANERLIDMKEQQDAELERSRADRAALLKQLNSLQDWQPDNEANSQRISQLEFQLQQTREKCIELEEILEQRLISDQENTNVNIGHTDMNIDHEVTAASVPTVESGLVLNKPETTEVGICTDSLQITENQQDSFEAELRKLLDTKDRELKAREEEHHSLAAYIAQLRGALEAKSTELASLENNPRELKSELDTALYMLHQRDVRCDELTLELMALMEERDTLQLRLSSALRLNERLNEQQRVTAVPVSVHKDEQEDLSQQQELHSKLSELRAVGHTRDVLLRGEQEVRNSEQRQILMPVSSNPSSTDAATRETLLETNHTLLRDSQSTSTVLFNWLLGRR